MAVELNGTATRRRVRKSVAVDVVNLGDGVEQKGKRVRKAAAPKPLPLKRWAYTGVGLTLGLSGWLNGLAFSAAAPVAWHGWVLGVSIPVAVLIFSRVAALCYGCGRRSLAYG